MPEVYRTEVKLHFEREEVLERGKKQWYMARILRDSSAV
jgi:hypothetical protein